MEIADSVLVNNHDLLQNVMKITTNAIFVIDLQGKFISLNIAGSTITGYSVNELK